MGLGGQREINAACCRQGSRLRFWAANHTKRLRVTGLSEFLKEVCHVSQG